MLTGADLITLKACARVNRVDMAYYPGPQFAGNASYLLQTGHIVLSPALTGGFRITVKGEMELERADGARILNAKPRPAKKSDG